MSDTTPVATQKDFTAAIAYIGPLFLYTAWKKPMSAFHLSHAKNAAGLFVGEILVYMSLTLITWVIPFSLSMLSMMATLYWLIRVIMAVASLYGAWETWNGKLWNIPVLSKIGESIPLEKWFHPSTQSNMSAPTPVELGRAHV